MSAHFVLFFLTGRTVPAGDQREDAHPSAQPVPVYIRAHRFHNAGELVSRYQGVGVRACLIDPRDVRPADADGFYGDQRFVSGWYGFIGFFVP